MDGLQLSLLLGLAITSAISLASIIWALSLDRKLNKRTAPKVYEVKIDTNKIFSETDMTDIQDRAHKQLEDITDQAAVRLRQSLNNTVDQMAARLNDMTENNISQEFEKYQVSLQALREQSIEEFSKLQRELNDRKVQLTEQLDKKIVDEFTARMDQFNTRLSDVVVSYLAESLGNQVDLGAQTTYILQALEAHKENIKKDILA